MKKSFRGIGAGVAVGAMLITAACAPPSKTASSGPSAATATSAASFGMDKLIAQAKKEGAVNLIATPADWANYGAAEAAFTAKYGIKFNSANPNGTSADEVAAVQQLGATTRAPDVLDLTPSVALANTNLFARYEVATWADIPATQKDATGLWVNDYGGYMAIGYDSARVPPITSIQDLTKPAYKNKVALNGDPTKAGAALNGVVMTALATGGSLDDISKGVTFYKNLKKIGNFIPVDPDPASVKSGTTPVVVDWDYLQEANTKEVPTWKVYVPSNAILGGYYNQAINKQAPHPAAARLWEDFLYSDAGQNFWLQGGARPVRMAAMTAGGTIDAAAAKALPAVAGTPVFPSQAQVSKIQAYLAANWAQAIS